MENEKNPFKRSTNPFDDDFDEAQPMAAKFETKDDNKMETEDIARSDNGFLSDRENKAAKIWGNGSESSFAVSSSSSTTENDYLIELPIQQVLINELDDLFGGGLFGTLGESNKVQQRCLIKRSTAQLLFKDIVESVHSQLEEEKLQKIEKDHAYAMQLLENEKKTLFDGPSTSTFHEKLDTQCDMWWQEQDPDEFQMNKEKLYAAFPIVEKIEIDNIFDAMNGNFKETIAVLKDTLDMNAKERHRVNEIIANYHGRIEMSSYLNKMIENNKGMMIDLHYLKLKEASVFLNIFIDNKITWLRSQMKSYAELDIITGRGAHSSNGIANMKIMAMKLLQERCLKPMELKKNPGAIKVIIYHDSLLFDEIHKLKN